MAILVVGTSLPLRAHSHARICLPVLYGDAPLSPRVWAHHSPSPKRNLRKGWFFELCFFCGRLNSTRFYSILLLLLDFDSILLDSTRFYSILLKFMQNQCKSQITTTQASASPGDSSMGTTGPDYMGIGMGPTARPGFVRKLYKKTCNLDTPPRALRGPAHNGTLVRHRHAHAHHLLPKCQRHAQRLEHPGRCLAHDAAL